MNYENLKKIVTFENPKKTSCEEGGSHGLLLQKKIIKRNAYYMLREKCFT